MAIDNYFAHQGGDLRNYPNIRVDLSTCINSYGPSQDIVNALKNIPTEYILHHPYDATAQIRKIYSNKFNLKEDAIVVGRGTTEFIWSLSKFINFSDMGLVMPSYTDFIRAFPGCKYFYGKYDLESLEEALKSSKYVLISNPHNPTSKIFNRSDLIDLCSKYRSSSLIIDESYMDFIFDANNYSLLGSDLDNVVVLRSPSKFYSIAGTRVGMLWTNNNFIRNKCKAFQDTWPISGIDAFVVQNALQNINWENEMKIQLAEDGIWLENILEKMNYNPIKNQYLHFRFFYYEKAEELRNYLISKGILIRILGEKHGALSPAVRITAPSNQKCRILLEDLLCNFIQF